MWDLNYGQEPMDWKLLAIHLLKKIWMIVASVLAGALLIGGTYFLAKVVFGPAKEYQSVSKYYIDFALDENGEVYEYFNQYTWEDLIKTDAIIEYALEQMETPVEKDEMLESVSATLLSDTRVLTAYVTTNSETNTLAIAKALELSIIHFGEQQKEISQISILTAVSKADQVIADIRTLRAFILGGVLGLFISLTSILLIYIWDDSVYIPATFERRYHIPMLGTIYSKELIPNLTFLARDCNTIAFVPIDEDLEITYVIQKVEEELEAEAKEDAFVKVLGVGSVVSDPSRSASLREVDGIILVVRAADHNGKLIEKTLSLLSKQDIKIKAALLWEADEALQRCYYGRGVNRA